MPNCQQQFNAFRWLELRHKVISDVNGLSDSELKEFKRLNDMADKEGKKDQEKEKFFKTQRGFWG